MFKKLRDKISEEVQQTSLRLPTSVQQITQQFTSGAGVLEGIAEPFTDQPPGTVLQDELLVDISGIQPAGDNKDLFSIDEESHEGSPIKSNVGARFHVIDLQSDNCDKAHLHKPPFLISNTHEQHQILDSSNFIGVEGLTFDPSSPTPSTPLSPISPSHPVDGEGTGSSIYSGNSNRDRGSIARGSLSGLVNSAGRTRRDSMDSNMSDVSNSGLFRISEVPGVSFSVPQSDLESASEWEEGSMTGGISDRITKDMLYQAYAKMRQRYHKYKGRYADVVKAYREKERETEKLRDVLAKTQDKAVRRVSELREQCSLETQAKAHLEEELRSDLEEKDHMIAALQTKVRLLQDGYGLMNHGSNASNENNNNSSTAIAADGISKSCASIDSGLAGTNWEDTNAGVKQAGDEDEATSGIDGSTGVCGDGNDGRVMEGQHSGSEQYHLTEGGDVTAATTAAGDGDNVSMVSLGSVSTNTAVSAAASVVSSYSQLQAEELIDRLKVELQTREAVTHTAGEVSQHKHLLGRCMENIRNNKDRLASLTMERDSLAAQLTARGREIEALKEQHGAELEELRHSVESSALSMAETKQHLFEELQRKERQVECLKEETTALSEQLRQQEASHALADVPDAEDEVAAMEKEAVRMAALMCLESPQAPPEQEEPTTEARLAEALSSNEALTEETSVLRDEKRRLDTRLDDLTEKNRLSEELVSQLTDDCAEMEAKLSSMEKKNERLKTELDNLNGSYNGLQTIVQRHISEKNELAVSIKELGMQLKRVEESNASLTKRSEELLVERETLKQQLADTEESRAEVSQELDDVTREKQTISEKLIEMEKNESTLNDRVISIMNDSEEMRRELKELKLSSINKDEKIEKSEKERHEALKNIDSIKNELEQVRNEREKAREDHESLLCKVETTSEEVRNLKLLCATLDADLKESSKQCQEIESRYSCLSKAHSQASQSTLTYEQQVKHLEQRNAELSSGSEDTLKQVVELRDRLEVLVREKKELEQEKMAIERLLSDMSSEKTRLEEELQGLNEQKEAFEREKRSLVNEKERVNNLKRGVIKERDELAEKYSSEKAAKEESNRHLIEMEKEIIMANEERERVNKCNEDLAAMVRKLQMNLQNLEKGTIESEEAVKEWKDKWRLLHQEVVDLRIEAEATTHLRKELNERQEQTMKIEKELQTVKEHLQAKDQQLAIIKNEMDVKEKEIVDIRAKLILKDEEIDNINNDLSNKLSSKLQEVETCGQTIQELNDRLWAVLDEMDHQKTALAECEERRQLCETELTEWKERARLVEKAAKEAQEVRNKLEEAQVLLDAELLQRTGQVVEAEAKLAEASQQLLELENVVNSRECELTEVAKARDSMNCKVQELGKQLSELQEELNSKQDEVEVARGETVSVNSDCLILEEKVKKLMMLLEEREEEVERGVQEREKLVKEIEDVEEQYQSLRRETDESLRVSDAVLQGNTSHIEKLKEKMDLLAKEKDSKVLDLTQQLETTGKILSTKESELENMQADMNRVNNLLMDKDVLLRSKSDECQQLLGLITEREAKISELLAEKQALLSSYDNKVGELNTLLEGQQATMKKISQDYEERIEALEEDHTRNEELYKNQVANILQDKVSLSKLLGDQHNSALQQERVLQQQVSALTDQLKVCESQRTIPQLPGSSVKPALDIAVLKTLQVADIALPGVEESSESVPCATPPTPEGVGVDDPPQCLARNLYEYVGAVTTATADTDAELSRVHMVTTATADTDAELSRVSKVTTTLSTLTDHNSSTSRAASTSQRGCSCNSAAGCVCLSPVADDVAVDMSLSSCCLNSNASSTGLVIQPLCDGYQRRSFFALAAFYRPWAAPLRYSSQPSLGTPSSWLQLYVATL